MKNQNKKSGSVWGTKGVPSKAAVNLCHLLIRKKATEKKHLTEEVLLYLKEELTACKYISKKVTLESISEQANWALSNASILDLRTPELKKYKAAKEAYHQAINYYLVEI